MVISSLSERRGAGPGRFQACWITGDPFIVSSTLVKRVVRTMALSSIRSTLLVCLFLVTNLSVLQFSFLVSNYHIALLSPLTACVIIVPYIHITTMNLLEPDGVLRRKGIP